MNHHAATQAHIQRLERIALAIHQPPREAHQHVMDLARAFGEACGIASSLAAQLDAAEADECTLIKPDSLTPDAALLRRIACGGEQHMTVRGMAGALRIALRRIELDADAAFNVPGTEDWHCCWAEDDPIGHLEWLQLWAVVHSAEGKGAWFPTSVEAMRAGLVAEDAREAA